MPTIQDIQIAVADEFRIPIIEMTSRRRGRDVARPRQVAMWLARKLTRCSYPEIGRHFGDRNHTTIIHGFHTINTLGAYDPDLGARIVDLMERLGGEPQ